MGLTLGARLTFGRVESWEIWGLLKGLCDNYETMTWKSKSPSLRFLISNISATHAPKCKMTFVLLSIYWLRNYIETHEFTMFRCLFYNLKQLYAFES